MAWLNPAAFVLLSAAAVPLLIHLLLRRRATRIPFPTLRFVISSQHSAVRLREPSDIALLLVRMAIVATGALAIARPLMITDARRQQWLTRTTRAIVLDTSASVRADRAVEAAMAEARAAIAVRRFDSPQPASALPRAAAWLTHAQPSLREIVVISDFQRGALSSADVAHVPAGIGLRFVRVDRGGLTAADVTVPSVWHDGRAYARTATLEGDATRVVLRPAGGTGGLEVDGATDGGRRILEALGGAGTVAPAPDKPILVRVGHHDASLPSSAWSVAWMRDATFRLLASPGMEAVALRAAPQNGRLVLDVEAAADSVVPAQVAAAALSATYDIAAAAEHEPQAIPESTLNGWSRRPAPPDNSAWRLTTDSDGRWFWLVALVLLGIEGVLRRSGPHSADREQARAA